MALKFLSMIIESLLHNELNLNDNIKIICQIIFAVDKLDVGVIRFMCGK